MGLFSWLSTSEKVVDGAVDLVKQGANGLDMLFFTDEERSITSGKIMEQVIAINKATADENSVRSKTRRFLAVLIIGNYLAMLNIAVVLRFFEDFDGSKFVFDVANTALGSHALAVVIFYFGYYGINAVVKSVKK